MDKRRTYEGKMEDREDRGRNERRLGVYRERMERGRTENREWTEGGQKKDAGRTD